MGIFFRIVLWTFSISLILLIISATLLGKAAQMDEYIGYPYIISLPVYPKADDPYGKLYLMPEKSISQLYNQQFSTIADIEISDTQNYLSFYLLHNLYSYDFHLAVSSLKGTNLFENSYKQNMDITNPEIPNVTMKQLSKYQIFKYGDDLVQILCPYQTQITDKAFLSDFCNSTPQYTSINPNLSSPVLFNQEDYPYCKSGFRLNFTNFTGLPVDYVKTPQVYLAGLSKTSKQKTLIISGPLLGISLFFLILSGAFVLYEIYYDLAYGNN
ncbi:hypothetical protein TVAG_029670 [Trichomonas vaginalis G3]|uniref:Uncharacterized protein n=1 Tax=Trichomonas vaginalis (strain ATCC PRA-98 / G3) TaxID=412133 RepID=A2FKK1_TRIV3|nr:uncharacterized protein TVAGG3_1077380 [Trichomonas vaginalis G3]EAX94574.1 hypothetical protein TVAG_029670 [Trichomonas vaginalis G3]KAI5482781.1 hypothetical protein TVAGG3_1077380 [Trichomonas vaginalis G3]|eukprot:XP_001307504.1 hypothetical protein [Trichomonas vaginalis G3]